MIDGWRISCPCGNRGRVGDEVAFAIRGQLQGTPVQKCLRCGRGLFLLRPKGRVKTVPADQWAEMERVWVANFPEDAEPLAQPPDPIATPDPSAYDPTAVIADEADDHLPGLVFGNVIDTMTDTTAERTDLHPNGIQLAIACLTSAADTADALADVGDPDLDGTEDLIARLSLTDEDPAMRVVFALAWYFAFAFQGQALKSVDRDRWLEAMQEALDPTAALRPDDPSHLATLFDAYLSWGPDQAPTFPLALCRWVNLHLGMGWNETPDPASIAIISSACQAERDEFLEYARTATRFSESTAPRPAPASRSKMPTPVRATTVPPSTGSASATAPPPISGFRSLLGWIIDILVGWIVGSVLVSLVAAIIAVLIGLDETATQVLGQISVVVGTVLGIWSMRRWRRTRRSRKAR